VTNPNPRLLDERVVLIIPSLAVHLGLNEAVVLQQLHYVLMRNTAEVRDGLKSVRMTYADWQREFPWWSDSTIRRIFDGLRDAGLVRFTRTKEAAWYAIDHAAVDARLGTSRVADRAERSGQSEQNPCSEEGKEEEGLPGGEGTLFGGDVAPAEETPDEVALVWERWEQTFPGQNRGGLTGPRRRDLTKALNAVEGNLDVMLRAIAGFSSWLKSDRGTGRPEIPRVFATGMHDRKNLTDKIYGWADEAPSDTITTVHISEGRRREISNRKGSIVAMFTYGAQDDERSPYYVTAMQDTAWLKDNFGIEWEVVDGRPVFTEPTKLPEPRT
jgi:hypothetical protein